MSIKFTSIPCPSPHITASEADGEIILYANNSEQALIMNDSSALIWQICDGETTVGEIVRLLEDAFPDNKIQHDVFAALNTFLDAGVITLS